MAEFYDVTKGISISRFAQFEPDQTPNQIVNTSLDGTVYIQNIGVARKELSGSVYVTRPGRLALMNAHADGDLIQITLKHGTYYGRVTACKFGKRMGGNYFQADVTLAREAAP